MTVRLPSDLNEFHCQFPLLSLPDEMIGHVFSFLSIKDRMRARLCKRLDIVEMKHKYFVPRFIIDQVDIPIDSLKRIKKNAMFGYMKVNVSKRCLLFH